MWCSVLTPLLLPLQFCDRRWDRKYWTTYKVLDILQKVFYRSNPAREAFVEMCEDSYVQKMTFDSYLYKTVVPGGCLLVLLGLCGGWLAGVQASCGGTLRYFELLWRTTVLGGMQRNISGLAASGKFSGGGSPMFGRSC